jgi:hypothetical protein
MALDREARFAALFARLQSVTNWKTASRVNLGWSEFLALEQPTMVLVKTAERQMQQQRNAALPFLWELGAMAVILCRNTDPNEPPSIQLNKLIQAVEAALELQPGEKASPNASGPASVTGQLYTTLGGLCTVCAINGEVHIWEGAAEGVQNSQAVAWIPIGMLVPS